MNKRARLWQRGLLAFKEGVKFRRQTLLDRYFKETGQYDKRKQTELAHFL